MPQPMGQDEFDRMVMAHTLRGWKVVERSPNTAVLSIDPKMNHAMHVLLTICTLGLWLPVWLLVAATNRPKQIVLSRFEKRDVWLTKRERQLLGA